MKAYFLVIHAGRDGHREKKGNERMKKMKDKEHAGIRVRTILVILSHLSRSDSLEIFLLFSSEIKKKKMAI